MKRRQPSWNGRARAALGLALLGSAFATGGFAFWTTTGAGQGSIGAMSSMAPVAISDLSFVGPLWPGGPARTVAITVTNPNPFPVTVESVTPGPVSSDHPGCGAPADPSGVTVTVAARRTLVAARSSAVVEVSASMDATSPSACQGARFSAAFDLEVRQ